MPVPVFLLDSRAVPRIAVERALGVHLTDSIGL